VCKRRGVTSSLLSLHPSMSTVEQPNGRPTATPGKPPTSESSNWGYYYYKLAAVVLLVSAVAYNSSSSWSHPRQLPETYALCSPGGEKRIYTVDAENRRVECLLVRGSWVVGSGELGG
jgi:hypothetical protein